MNSFDRPAVADLRVFLAERYDAERCWLEVRKVTSKPRAVVSWSGFPPVAVLSEEVAWFCEDRGLPFEAVTLAHKPMWSCGHVHDSIGDAWVRHIGLTVSTSVGSTDDCGCWFGDDVFTVETLEALFGEAGRSLFDRFARSFTDSHVETVEGVDVFDARFAEALSSLDVATVDCHPGNFGLCPGCGGDGSFTDLATLTWTKCVTCDGEGGLDLDDAFQFELWTAGWDAGSRSRRRSRHR